MVGLLGEAVELFTSHLKPTADEIQGAGLSAAVDSAQSRGLPLKARAVLARHKSIRNLMLASTIHANVSKSLAEESMLPSALRTLRGMAYVIKAAGGCIGVDWAAVINAKEFEETKAKLGSGRGGSAKRKTAVDPEEVVAAAK